METNDYRIGNIIQGDGEILIVDSIEAQKVKAGATTFYLQNCDPEDINVDLTPEWCEKLGWTKKDITWFDNSVSKDVWLKGWHYIKFIDYDERKEIMYCSQNAEKQANYITSIKYVHQLMNVYHALTGQELTHL